MTEQLDPVEAALDVIMAQLDLCGHTEAGVRDTVRAALEAADQARCRGLGKRGREQPDPVEAACEAWYRGADMWRQCTTDIMRADIRKKMRAAVDAAEKTRWRAIEWLIWSQDHGAFWRPNRSGYTRDIATAGRYSFEEANHVCSVPHQRAFLALADEAASDLMLPASPPPAATEGRE